MNFLKKIKTFYYLKVRKIKIFYYSKVRKIYKGNSEQEWERWIIKRNKPDSDLVGWAKLILIFVFISILFSFGLDFGFQFLIGESYLSDWSKNERILILILILLIFK